MGSIKRMFKRSWLWLWMFHSRRTKKPTTGGTEETTQSSRQVQSHAAPAEDTADTVPRGPTASAREEVTDSTNNEATVSPQMGAARYVEADRLGTGACELFGLASHSWAATDSAMTLLDSVASGLKAFARVTDMIGEIHPYLRVATALISGISKPIISQDRRDTAFEEMLQEMIRTYELGQDELGLNGTATKTPISYEHKLLVEISRASKECAEFISHEYITTNFWPRALKNTLRGPEVDTRIGQFKTQFTSLRERWRDAKLKYLDALAVLNQLDFARGAGPTSEKICLPGTRTNILRSLNEWIDCPKGAQVRFLLGVAGCGKSTVANTVAMQSRDRSVLGAFFAFDRSATDRVPRRVLSTIAYELALWNERYRDALVYQLKECPKLAISNDIAEQWEHLILAPARVLSSSDPVLLVIDAFDECPAAADDSSRLRLLEMFTCQVSLQLPANFRVLITSRAERDITAATLPPQRLEIGGMLSGEDVLCYVRNRLPGPEMGGLSDDECETSSPHPLVRPPVPFPPTPPPLPPSPRACAARRCDCDDHVRRGPR